MVVLCAASCGPKHAAKPIATAASTSSTDFEPPPRKAASAEQPAPSYSAPAGTVEGDSSESMIGIPEEDKTASEGPPKKALEPKPESKPKAKSGSEVFAEAKTEKPNNTIGAESGQRDGCLHDLCLGMSFEDFEDAMESGELTATGKPDCDRPAPRMLSPSKLFPDTSRYIYNNPCGGFIEHIEFYFRNDKLIAFHVFFRNAYFRNVKLDDFIHISNDYFGKPTYQKWPLPGRDGTIEWAAEKSKTTLRIFSAAPSSIKFEDTNAQKEISSTEKENTDAESRKAAENLLKP